MAHRYARSEETPKLSISARLGRGPSAGIHAASEPATDVKQARPPSLAIRPLTCYFLVAGAGLHEPAASGLWAARRTSLPSRAVSSDRTDLGIRQVVVSRGLLRLSRLGQSRRVAFTNPFTDGGAGLRLLNLSRPPRRSPPLAVAAVSRLAQRPRSQCHVVRGLARLSRMLGLAC